MAVAPLFVPDMTTLKSKLRLTGVPAGVDATAMVDQAVMDVRLNFFRRITQPRCATIAAYSHTDTPLTDNEFLRALAESIETKWVRLCLMRVLPTVFMDASPLNQIWNQEAPFRSASQQDLAKEMNRLESEIEEALTLLSGDQTAGDESMIGTIDIGPDCPKEVGRSVFNDGTELTDTDVD